MLTDLTAKWYQLREKGFHLDECWRRCREELPELFDDYIRFWGSRPLSDVRIPSHEECQDRVNTIRDVYGEVGSRLVEMAGLTGPPPDLIVIVGSGSASGHAVKIGESFAAWVDVVSLPTPKQIRVFVTHELAHALHYTVNPSRYHSPATFHIVIRKLWTEGVATYLTMRTLDCTPEEALWADFLSPEELERWMARCSQNERRLWTKLEEAAWQTDTGDKFFFFYRFCFRGNMISSNNNFGIRPILF